VGSKDGLVTQLGPMSEWLEGGSIFPYKIGNPGAAGHHPAKDGRHRVLLTS
jgi:hypothetical protein